jgi:hypothetical protein
MTNAPAKTFAKYGLSWKEDFDALKIEMRMIREGGQWADKAGRLYGNGLSFHYEEMRKILWPHLDDHRWHSLCRDELLKHKITVFMGPGSSGKTHSASWVFLCEYFCFPQETLVLVSSTDVRGLRLRVWGEISDLWQQAKDKFDYLPGNLIDSRIAITTDALEDKEVDESKRVRDMRKGIVGIPTIQGNKTVGLGKWVGVKQKRIRLLADEAQLMGPSFLSAFANLNKNEDFRAALSGNPLDISDPLGMAAEPIDGWGSYMDVTKTTVWKTRFMGGVCVNLIGTDSPNFDLPGPARFKYLISREKIQETLSFFSKDSPEYYSQCVGSMKIAMMARRVITRQMCRDNNALEPAKWLNADRTRVSSLDAAYGGDRCMFGWGEFGTDIEGRQILYVYPPENVPIIVGKEEPEDQIARFVKHRCEDNRTEADNFFPRFNRTRQFGHGARPALVRCV